jgi:hypothetical protein
MWGGRKEGRVVFSTKRSKRFFAGCRRLSGSETQRTKVFWFFFFKKEQSSSTIFYRHMLDDAPRAPPARDTVT